MNLYLIGYRGTGKSTVAAGIAEKLDWNWVDADVALEKCEGRTIAEIFASDGEPRFREIESEVLASLAGQQNQVVALGGGAVLREPNRRLIRESGMACWLTAPADVCFERISGDPGSRENRPDLTDRTGLDEVRHLLAVREPIYRECADFSVDTASQTPEEIVEQIVQLFTPHLKR